MKKLGLLILSTFIFLVFSFDIMHAEAASAETDKLAQIKEVRMSIKHHLKANEKLEKQIDKKSRQIDKLLVKLPENSLVSQEVIDNELNPRFEKIMTQLMQVGAYETSSWKHLKIGNRQIANKNYSAGLKNLKEADMNLKQKHEAMISFNEQLEEFYMFISSLQHK